MNYIQQKSVEELYEIIEIIEKFLLKYDYKNAFVSFLLLTERMNPLDRDELIRYFNKYIRIKYTEKNNDKTI
jgi:hypothetical protein